jgi:glycosyltransferase involved in cell wall biosynthesis
VPDNVELYGRVNSVSELNNLYNTVDFTVSYSIEESFGLTLAESLVAGTPVISNRVGFIPDVLSFSPQVPPVDPIAKRLDLECKIDPNIEIRQYLSYENWINKYVDLYETIYSSSVRQL